MMNAFLSAAAGPLQPTRRDEHAHRWQRGKHRLGEADNPGPEGGNGVPSGTEEAGLLLITTQNCTSLDANMDAVTGMAGHIKLLQEVRALQLQMTSLEARLGKAGHIVAFGRPCEVAARTMKKHSGLKEHTTKRTATARHGGVAIIARSPQTLVTKGLLCLETAELAATSRWTEAFAPVKVADRRGTGVYLASLGGHAGARHDPEAMRLNENLIAKTPTAAARVGDVPYVLGMDANVLLEESVVLTQAMSTGIGCDALEIAAESRLDATAPTCCNARGWDRGSWR